MEQAADFLAESEALAAVLVDLPDAAWNRATQFKDWTINDVVVHLYFWNRAADLSLTDQEAFQDLMTEVHGALAETGLRPLENARIKERGQKLFSLWSEHFRGMAERWATVDPKTRVKWAGPDMSARSSITARQMETWAHGHEIFDVLGRTREEEDRIRNIVVLGVNTFGWSHKVQELDIPEVVPELRLIAPSGAVWSYGQPGNGEIIEGLAVSFAQVVTQTRNVADTDLAITGRIARRWMETAQCFAGKKETPPPPGTRFVTGGQKTTAS